MPGLHDGESRRDFEEKLIIKALEDANFKQKLIKNPRAVIAYELGTQLPANIEVKVLEETEHILYIVLPLRT